MNTNVLQIIGLNEFIKLCIWMFGQERYKKEFIVSSNPLAYGEQKPHRKSVVNIKASDTEGTIFTEVYPCSGQYIGSATSADTNVEYALALTNMDDWVTVFKTINVPNRMYSHLHALEVVKNLDEDYLKNCTLGLDIDSKLINFHYSTSSFTALR